MANGAGTHLGVGRGWRQNRAAPYRESTVFIEAYSGFVAANQYCCCMYIYYRKRKRKEGKRIQRNQNKVGEEIHEAIEFPATFQSVDFA